MKLSLFLSLLPIISAAPAPVEKRAAPTVIAPVPGATVVGRSLESIDSFMGIPYAQPPVGPLRLKPPQSLTSPLGVVVADDLLPTGCPQFAFSIDDGGTLSDILGPVLASPLLQKISKADEDCLTVNVQRPAGTPADAKLPVLFWIYGGAFEIGATQTYDGSSLIKESVADGKPIIFVAVNYRVGGYGFLAGKEILADGSSNIGLLDQRHGLKWVADNIAAFGGDPDKVTIWGESAGAISVLDQMVLYDGDNTYNGKALFRGGIMNSGGVTPAEPVDSKRAQVIYDEVVAAAGCSGKSDTLACLRSVDAHTFLTAANSVPGFISYSSNALSYLPRPDGTVLTDSPEALIAAGKYAKVPHIIGDQEDEGTFFAVFQHNISTIPELSTYLNDYYFPEAPKEVIDGLIATYQTISDDGSPFRTGTKNNWYPQFKRLAAILGDLTFNLSRRLFLDLGAQANPDVKSWSYLASYDHGTALLGTFHASDLLQVFYGIKDNNAAKSIRGYYYSFIYDLDPNSNNTLDNWPEWKSGKQLIEFGAGSNSLLTDDYRSDSYEFIKSNAASFKA